MKDGVGEQSIDVDLSLIEIYKVLTDNFPDYNVELKYVPERLPSKAYHYIYMYSEKYRVKIHYQKIHYQIDRVYKTFKGIYLFYYLNGKNRYERIDELKIPMENIKQCLIYNFPDYLSENNFTEGFSPLSIY
jgi:hypothetical protein